MGNTTFSANLKRLIDDVEPLIRKLEERGKIPDNASVARISRQDFPVIAELHSLLIPIVTETLSQRFEDEETPSYSSRFSRVLKVGEQVVGCCLFLSGSSANSVFLFAVVIDPTLRRTWANAWLKYKTFHHLTNCGIETILFEAFENNADTINHANRVGAERLSIPPEWCT